MSLRVKKNARFASHCPASESRPTELSAMKPTILVFALLLAVPTVMNAQTQNRDRRSTGTESASMSESNTMRNRVVGPKVSNHADGQKSQGDSTAETGTLPQKPEPQGDAMWGNAAVILLPSSADRTNSIKPAQTNSTPQVSNTQQEKKLVQPTSQVSPQIRPENANSRTLPTARPATSTTSYIVGVGDVLDVRLTNVATRESTLFTVLKNGTLEYPLLNGPISVAGLSTDEIARLLASEIKVIKSPRITVSVRDYASHTVIVGGLVDSPGKKILRREAMPLFAVLAEALVRPEGTVATVLRNGKESDPLSLKDDQATATLVLPGDIIKISGAPVAAKRFLYVGGEVSSPGEKAYREGMTLTQALLSAGGTSPSGKTIKIARRNAAGFLSTNEYNLRSIEDGKTPDPLLEAGDRIEVTRGM